MGLGEGRAGTEAQALLDYDADRPPEGGLTDAGDLTASSLPLLDCDHTSGRANLTAERGLSIKSEGLITLLSRVHRKFVYKK